MFQGFYNLASGMMTQNRILNTISNNLSNVTTPGYKADTMTTTTFQEEMMYRNGNQVRGNQQQLGSINMIRVPEQTITDFEQGNFVATGNQLDFAINGSGFFQVETAAGYAYTRNGSFYVDEDNCLALQGVGKVQGIGGEIYLETDDIQVDGSGGIYDIEGELIDNLLVVDFADYTTLVKGANGVFTTNAEPEELETANIMNETVENSNANSIKEMENMMSTQRSIQSASQVLKMYDQMMSKAVTEIGKI